MLGLIGLLATEKLLINAVNEIAASLSNSETQNIIYSILGLLITVVLIIFIPIRNNLALGFGFGLLIVLFLPSFLVNNILSYANSLSLILGIFLVAILTAFAVFIKKPRVFLIIGSLVIPFLIYKFSFFSYLNIFLFLLFVFVGIYLGWRSINEDDRYIWIRKVALSCASIYGTNFTKATLTGTCFTEAILENTNFSSATVTRTCWKKAINLNCAVLSNTHLSQSSIRDLLVTRDGYKKNYVKANLRGANLDCANLREANFKLADLGEASLQSARLCHANLTQVNAVNTDFSDACLTGACIEAWHINHKTKLDRVKCKYVFYLEKPNQYGHQERHPHIPDKMFQARDFEKQCKKITNIVQLWLRNSDNPKAFAMALQQLMIDNPQAKFKSMEEKEGDFLFSYKVPEETDKAQVERKFDEARQNYLKSITNSLNSTEQLKLGDRQTLIFNFHINTEAKNMTNSSENYQTKYDQHNAHIGGFVDSAQSGSNPEFHQHNYVSQNLTEAAKEIQQLLDQLSRTYPTNSTTEKMIVATKAIEVIEYNPTWKEKAILACQQGLLEAMKTHPIGAFVVGAIEGWKP